MGVSFFAYLEQIELMAFFSGYPLFYAIVRVIAGRFTRGAEKKSHLVSHLPGAYALVATLYLGLQIRVLYPDYSFAHMHLPYLKAWAAAAVIFWLPVMAKNPVLSLLHSIVFFFFIIRDIFLQVFASPGDTSMVKNDMKLFSASVLFNMAAFLANLFVSWLSRRFQMNKKS